VTVVDRMRGVAVRRPVNWSYLGPNLDGIAWISSVILSLTDNQESWLGYKLRNENRPCAGATLSVEFDPFNFVKCFRGEVSFAAIRTGDHRNVLDQQQAFALATDFRDSVNTGPRAFHKRRNELGFAVVSYLVDG